LAAEYARLDELTDVVMETGELERFIFTRLLLLPDLFDLHLDFALLFHLLQRGIVGSCPTSTVMRGILSHGQLVCKFTQLAGWWQVEVPIGPGSCHPSVQLLEGLSFGLEDGANEGITLFVVSEEVRILALGMHAAAVILALSEVQGL
jgi:hypothetical protein